VERGVGEGGVVGRGGGGGGGGVGIDWIGFIWLRIGTRGGFFLMWK
jgi:hypothetical protein